MAKVTRVCLIGPESTGKTELAQVLAQRFGAPWSPEFAREYALDVARPLTAHDVEPIARGQIAGEDRAAAGASNLLILDTDLVSTCVYAEYYYGSVPQWIEEEARRRSADHYLLMDIDVPFIADAARDIEEARPLQLEVFRRRLRELGVEPVIIRGGWDERREQAVAFVQAFLR